MLLFLPWVFMLVAIAGVILLWDDYLKETRYNKYERKNRAGNANKEGMMLYESENIAGRYHKAGRRRYRKCC